MSIFETAYWYSIPRVLMRYVRSTNTIQYMYTHDTHTSEWDYDFRKYDVNKLFTVRDFDNLFDPDHHKSSFIFSLTSQSLLPFLPRFRISVLLLPTLEAFYFLLWQKN